MHTHTCKRRGARVQQPREDRFRLLVPLLYTLFTLVPEREAVAHLMHPPLLAIPAQE